jgi:hypothetical protein
VPEKILSQFRNIRVIDVLVAIASIFSQLVFDSSSFLGGDVELSE